MVVLVGGSNNTYYLRGNTWGKNDTGNGFTITSTSGLSTTIRIDIKSGTICNNLLFKPMIVEGSTAQPYEQYTGGIPAPNPSYPFPIKSVTGNNNVVVNSKNLINMVEYNKSVTSSGSVSSDNTNYLGFNQYVSCRPNTTYTITFQHDIEGTTLYIGYKDNTGTFLSRVSNGTSKTFTTPNNAYELFCYLYKTGTTFNTTGGYVQLEYGNTPTSYVPYGNQTLPLNLGTIELNKIGTYQDYIYKTSGKNLFDRANATENATLKWADGDIYTGVSATGGISSDYFKIAGIEKIVSNYTFCIFFYDSNKTYLGNGVQVKKESYGATYTSITIPYGVAPNIYYARIEFRPNENNSEDMTTKNLMVNLGSTALPYEPYGSGEWYKHEEIKKIICKNFSYNLSAEFANVVRARAELSPIMTLSEPNGLCNAFIFKGDYYQDKEHFYIQQNGLWQFINKSRLSEVSAAGVNAYIQANNFIAYGILEVPNNIKITETSLIAQLEAIDKMKSYEGTTIITSTYDTNNAQMIISASGLKELE